MRPPEGTPPRPCLETLETAKRTPPRSAYPHGNPLPQHAPYTCTNPVCLFTDGYRERQPLPRPGGASRGDADAPISHHSRTSSRPVASVAPQEPAPLCGRCCAPRGSPQCLFVAYCGMLLAIFSGVRNPRPDGRRTALCRAPRPPNGTAGAALAFGLCVWLALHAAQAGVDSPRKGAL